MLTGVMVPGAFFIRKATKPENAGVNAEVFYSTYLWTQRIASVDPL